MKKIKFVCLIGLIAVIPMLIGCATPMPVGFLYTELKLPVAAEEGGNMPVSQLKKGEATCMSVLGLVATGDCSIDTAMKNGGLKKIHYVDWDVKNILGVIGNYKVTVYGE